MKNYKPNYAKEFEKQLGNPIEQVNKLIKQAHLLNQKYPVDKTKWPKARKTTPDKIRVHNNWLKSEGLL